MIKRIDITELKPGMYVCGLEKRSGMNMSFMNNILVKGEDIQRFIKSDYLFASIDEEYAAKQAAKALRPPLKTPEHRHNDPALTAEAPRPVFIDEIAEKKNPPVDVPAIEPQKQAAPAQQSAHHEQPQELTPEQLDDNECPAEATQPFGHDYNSYAAGFDTEPEQQRRLEGPQSLRTAGPVVPEELCACDISEPQQQVAPAGPASEPAPAKGQDRPAPVIETDKHEKKTVFDDQNEPEIKDKVEFKEEIRQAQKIKSEAEGLVKEFLSDAKMGRAIKTEKVHATVEKMVDSIFCNQDALASLSRLKSFDNYTFTHSVNVCILSVTIARHMGFKKEYLHDLGVGAILHDIGKMLVPETILNKPGTLTDKEFEVMKSHTVLGSDLLQKTKEIKEESRFVALQHQEKFDGTGYPHKLAGNNIHIFGRIAAVADVFDAMTSKRVYKSGMPPEEALKKMYMLRGKHFEPQIVERLIKCLGIYPIGNVVELNTGEIALVRMTNHTHPVQPLVLMLMDNDKRPCPSPFEIDLKNDSRWIVASRDPGNLGISVDSLLS